MTHPLQLNQSCKAVMETIRAEHKAIPKIMVCYSQHKLWKAKVCFETRFNGFSDKYDEHESLYLYADLSGPNTSDQVVGENGCSACGGKTIQKLCFL